MRLLSKLLLSMSQPIRTNWLVLVLVAVGFAARFGLALALGLNGPPAPGSDQEEYDTYAWNLAQGRGYRGMSVDVTDRDHLTAYRPPGPSLVWAGLYVVFGHRYDVVRLTHCLLGAATVAVVYGIGRRCFSQSVGLLAAAAYAVYPTALLYATDLLSEPLGNLLLSGFILACLGYAVRPTWGRAVFAGLLLGLTALTRSNAVFLLPLYLVWALWQFRSRPKQMALALLILVVAGATLGPWTMRNYLVFHRFVPLSTLGGGALLQGNNRVVVTDPIYYGTTYPETKLPEYREALRAPDDEFERERVARDLAVQWLRDHPEHWGFLVQAKLRRAWTPFLNPETPRLYRLGMLLSWGPVLVLFAVAFVPTLWSFLRSGHPGWLIHLAILHYALNSVVFFGYARYRSAVEPLCLILAAQAVCFGFARLREVQRLRRSRGQLAEAV
jgi:4-amino-4-deoxy-L-arabinose transferase-like glycosyltransferase